MLELKDFVVHFLVMLPGLIEDLEPSEQSANKPGGVDHNYECKQNQTKDGVSAGVKLTRLTCKLKGF